MELKDFLNAGSDILDAVSNAVDTNDYSNLSKTVRITVSKIAGDASDSMRSAAGQAQAKAPAEHAAAQAKDPVNHAPAQAAQNVPFFLRRPGKTTPVLKIVFGSIWSLLWGCIDIVVLFILLLDHAAGFLTFALISSALTAGGIFFLGSGINTLSLIGRFYQYGYAVGNQEYFTFRELAERTKRKEAFLRKDLKRMAARGMLPQLHTDDSHTTCMLTDQVYQQYLALEEQRKVNAAQEQQAQQQLQAAGNAAEVKSILEEGDAYLKTIHTCNDEIPDEVMSDKLYQLEEIMKRIFDQVRKQPKTAADLHKFMNYYLPTTTKLLYAYIDLEKQPEVGNNITGTKHEIEATLDTINQAFEKLLDNLFQDMAWDISSDISVMKTMMARDGLTDNHDFQEHLKGETNDN